MAEFRASTGALRRLNCSVHVTSRMGISIKRGRASVVFGGSTKLQSACWALGVGYQVFKSVQSLQLMHVSQNLIGFMRAVLESFW